MAETISEQPVSDRAKDYYSKHHSYNHLIQVVDAQDESVQRDVEMLLKRRDRLEHRPLNVLKTLIGHRAGRLVRLDDDLSSVDQLHTQLDEARTYHRENDDKNTAEATVDVEAHLEEFVADAQKDAEADGVHIETEKK